MTGNCIFVWRYFRGRLQKFRKERPDWQRKNIYNYYDKAAGIAIGIMGQRIDGINLFPSKKSYSLLCENQEVKEYYSSKRLRRSPKRQKVIIDYNLPANVVDLILSEAISDCSINEGCPSGKFLVSTTAKDAEYDILTYVYKVSAGRIVGSGPKVIWDLSDVKSGTYTITAAVDDGCGLCGKTVTKTVVIK